MAGNEARAANADQIGGSMSVKTVVLSIVFAVVLVAAVVGVVYGVTTHAEPGLMAETPGFGPSDTPIGVCAVLYSAEGPGSDEDLSSAIELTRGAVATTNDRLGMVVYRYLDPADPGSCRVRVSVGEPSDVSEPGLHDPGGDAVFRAGEHACMISTSNTVTDEITSLVIQHELGHCLGLADDCFNASIMCGDHCCEMQASSPGTYPPRITDSDRALLRGLYGR